MAKKPDFDLPYYNTTNYPLAVKNQLSAVPYTDQEVVLLKYHQFVVKEFFTRNPDQRGMLICHGMGFGKTRLAVSIAEDYRTYDSRRRVVVLSAKSLATNFQEEVKSFTKHNDEYIAENYQFVSLNSSNMFKQITDLNKSTDERLLEKKLGDFLEAERSSLENSLLIIDEAHNLFNSATNGAKNALALYDLIMNTANIKLIFMSGTPIINGPFELVPCFNMLRGYIRVDGRPDKATGGVDDIIGADDSDVLGGDNSDKDAKDADHPEDNSADAIVDADTIPDVDYTENVEDKPKSDRKSNQKSKSKGPMGKSFGRRKEQKSIEHATLFSEDIDEFYDYFVDRDKKEMKNKSKFTNRIFGLVSYYGNLYFASDKDKPGFPRELDNVIERVPMSQEQFSRYMSARILEQEETKRVYKGATKARFSAAKGEGTTYRVKTRQISNYCIPEYALGPVRGAKAREKFIDKITIEDLQNTNVFSPKMGRILSNIEGSKHTGQLGMVYSQFVSGEGIGIFARVLKANGYKQFNELESASTMDDFKVGSYGGGADDLDVSYGGVDVGGDADVDYDENLDELNKDVVNRESNAKKKSDVEKTSVVTTSVKSKSNTQPVFAILSGDIDPEQRQATIDAFNNPKNADGSIIRLLLLSGAVAEGIDLKRIRHVHVMEPFWNYARINQVKTRAIRFQSHIDLPVAEQNVQVYVYLSDYPVGYPLKKITEPSTDVDLYDKSIGNMKLIDSFMIALAEASIDCSIHSAKLDASVKARISCKLCAPDNAQLYHPILRKDMELPSSCQEYSEKKVSVNEIMIPNSSEKFYYKKGPDGNITLYHYNKKLNGFAPMLRANILYGNIMEAVLMKEGI